MFDKETSIKQRLNLEDLSRACFALGRFVDYRLDDGFDEADLEPFKQAFFNLRAHLLDQEYVPNDEPLTLEEAELLSTHLHGRGGNVLVLPSFVSPREKLEHVRLWLDNPPNTDGD